MPGNEAAQARCYFGCGQMAQTASKRVPHVLVNPVGIVSLGVQKLTTQDGRATIFLPQERPPAGGSET